MIYRLCLIIIIIIFSSCRNESLFNQYNSMPMVWHKDSIVKFNFQIKDSFQRYNTYIKVRARMGSKMPVLPKYNKSTIIGRRSAKRGNKPPKFLKVFDNPSKSPPKKKSIRKTNL